MAETLAPPAGRPGPVRTESAAPAHRQVRRRQALPSGRAVVGGLLVAVSALGIFLAWSWASGGPTTSYLVAARDLPVGSELNAADVRLVPIELPPALASGAAFTDASAVSGATVVGPIRAGELVQAGSLVKRRGEPAEVELSFSIDATRALAGSLRAGERVDVLATFGAGGDTYTAAVVRSARLLRIDQARGGLGGQQAVTLTVALAQRADALALAHALNAGEVFVARSPAGDPGTGTDVYRAPSAEEAPNPSSAR